MWPVVVMPSATKLLLTLFRAHASLPPELAGRVVAELPDNFPQRLPYLQVRAVPGAGSRPVPIRLGQSQVDLHVYAADYDIAEQLARTVAGIAQSLVGAATNEGGITDIDVTEPFPLPDETTAARWIVTTLVTYRPR